MKFQKTFIVFMLLFCTVLLIGCESESATLTSDEALTEGQTIEATEAPLDTDIPTRPPKKPSSKPIFSPTEAPTVAPTEAPWWPPYGPTVVETEAPTAAPTVAPWWPPYDPTVAPTEAPTAAPTEAPWWPPYDPTAAPTVAPTEAPTVAPTEAPTDFDSSDPLSSYPDPSLEMPDLKVLAVPAESTLTLMPGPVVDAKDCVTVTVKANDVYSGNLILVNPHHALKNDPGSIKDGLVNIFDLSAKDEIGAKYKLVSIKTTVRRDTYDAFVALMKTANAVNAKTSNVLIAEGYRTAAKQLDVFMANNGINALKPNHSDFQTGYSVHLKYYDTYTYSLAGDKSNADVAAAGTVIVNLADDFGFIRRYPEGKEAYTGVVGTSLSYLFRYVGVPHARVMTEGDYSLEEYIDGIKNYKESNPLRIEDSGYVYNVFYVPSAGDNKDTTFNVPKNHDYTWSGNNVDGFIVTVTMATPDAK